MRSKLRLFVGVGLTATAVDLGLFIGLSSRSIVGANLVALVVAANASYLLNRFITFRDEPDARWIRQPLRFGLVAVLAGALDFAVLFALDMVLPWLGIVKLLAISVAGVFRWFLYRGFLSALVRRELRDRTNRPPSDGELALSVVVPAYNEAERIRDTVETILEVVGERINPDEFEVVVVDDGSSDETSRIASDAGARVLTQVNKGKGAAVRTGVRQSIGRTVVFLDADLAYPASQILSIMDEVAQGWDVVVGSRRHQKTTTVVEARLLRSLGGRIINAFTHLVLLGHFRDTQCGIKGFRGDVARSIFDRTLIDGFAFDVEVFLIAEQNEFSLTEIPVVVENRAGSSVSLVRDTFVLLRDLFRVRRWAGEGRYRATKNHMVPSSETT